MVIHGRGLISDFSFYTLNNSVENHVVLWQDNDKPQHFGVFCRVDEVKQFTEALKQTTLIKREIIVHHTPHYLVKSWIEVGKHKGLQLDLQVGLHRAFVYHPPLQPQQYFCRAGYNVCHLGKAGIQLLLEMSRYNKNDSLEKMCIWSEKIPFVGVYRDPNVAQDTLVDPHNLPLAGDEDLPVCCIGTKLFGTLGMLRTTEEYKRKGLASLVVNVAAEIQTRLGFIPVCHVDVDNVPSRKMMEKLTEGPAARRASNSPQESVGHLKGEIRPSTRKAANHEEAEGLLPLVPCNG
ncbi:hypothetical protein Pmani_012425 [Petrolisthes manimaculis]|uniref:GCN5-related N-acetyltransferase Rv2170-like domain-containing protein n=1 Tax=Petrolisthes manimaculis TaxID=1843537 RepID=A0AAE1PZA9_9EUCA|nr:hypothetical protein Pmani_012425 [Petrolisthes manimaculis]